MRTLLHPPTVGLFFTAAILGAYYLFIPASQQNSIVVLLIMPVSIHIGAAIFTECNGYSWFYPRQYLRYHLLHSVNSPINRVGLGIVIVAWFGAQIFPLTRIPDSNPATLAAMSDISQDLVVAAIPIPVWFIYQYLKKRTFKPPGEVDLYIAWAGFDLIVIVLIKMMISHPLITKYLIPELPGYFWPLQYLIYTLSANLIYRRQIPPGICH